MAWGMERLLNKKKNKALTLIHHAIESKQDGIHTQNKSAAGELYRKKQKISKF